ncbi:MULTISPECIES: hypothetical protein [unclassified Luteimonas]|uniref:hypothetical protein n=1 Tax=unclassified Luteimonas TaxID=2629088 RepID=UPI00047A9788|nr:MULTISPECIES: hypothetical protein [unclassified Luteimonas]
MPDDPAGRRLLAAGVRARAGSGRAAASAGAARQSGAPYDTREFDIGFQFDSEFLVRRNTRKVEDAVRYIELAKPSRVRVEATRGVSRLSNGEDLVEPAGIAERRAMRIRRILVELGVPPDLLDVHWSEQPLPGNGIDDHVRRRVTVTVEVPEPPAT